MSRALLVLVALAAFPLRAAGEFKVHGFALPPGSVRVDEDRFRLPSQWEDAIKHFKSVYPPAKFPRRSLRNQAGLRAVHIANPAAADWDGANLYETRENKGEVRVFVLAHRKEK